LNTIQPTGSNYQDSDDFWTVVGESTLDIGVSSKEEAKKYQVFALNQPAFTRSLAASPMEFTESSRQTQTIISLPLPDGRLWRFHIHESPVMSAELASKFPEIKTYSGQGIDDPTATARFSWSNNGLNAFVISEQGSFLVVPFSEEPNRYVSYFTHDVEKKPFECLTGSEKASGNKSLSIEPRFALTNTTLRRYRVAVSVTPEFALFVAGENIPGQGTINAVTNYINNVRAIYEREIGVSFNLVAVWNPAAFGAPLINGGNFSVMKQQNQFFLDNLFVPGFSGSASYDVGMALGYSPSSPAGEASFGDINGVGAACQPSFKAQSAMVVTGPSTNDYLGIGLIAHELGHMFGARHTYTPIFGNDPRYPAACRNQADPTGMVEPGSGSTIMSYAGICPPDNLFTNNPQTAADNYFHVHSLIRIDSHKAIFPTCGQAIATGNSPPIISDGGVNATIPALTPFSLTATATDPNGHPLTYSWEEFDPGTTLFRSYVPSSSSSRTFPSLTYILNNGNVPPTFIGGFFSGEFLPATSRTLNFTLTVRDNRSGGGGTSARDQLLEVNVVGVAGPFKVNQPNTHVSLTSGGQTTITWSVAGTNLFPINTTSVRIRLSTDGGNTFPTVLANSTPNDGTEVVALPNVVTSTARIKIESIGNIYFDISDTNFVISNTSSNLTPYQPTAWSDKIVVSNTPGTNTDSSPLRTTDTIYVDWATINNGTAPIGTPFQTKLYVDGLERSSWVTNPPLDVNFFSFVQDFSIGSLSVGTHTLKIVTDATGLISESNELDNEYTKTITVVSPVQPNLTPFQPTGWSDKIVVSNTPGTGVDSNPLRTTDTLYVDWAAINNGTAATVGVFHTKLFVDGVERASWFSNPPLNVNFFSFVQDFSIGSLSAGTHTIRIVTDATGLISEGNELDNEYTRTITVSSSSGAVQFSAALYNIGEASGHATITVDRTNTTGAADVNYATSDAFPISQTCQMANTGIGSSRCDYITSMGTLRFAAGEASKTIFIPIVNDAYAEGNEAFTVSLSGANGTALGSPASATVTIQDNETVNGVNPIDGVDFFIRQQYLDFLGREPDPAGLAGWKNVLVNCGITIAPPCDRIEVSAGFFRSEEFQSRGYFIYRFFSAVGKIPLSSEFFPDFAKVSGFLTADQLEANKAAYVNEIMARVEFQTKYASTFSNPTAYVDALLQTVGLPTHPGRAGWIATLNSNNNTQTRGQVLRALVESGEVFNKYFNEAFVIMQYFGYLRRTADASYLNWIQTMNTTNGDYRTMISGFMNSSEYRRRFGP
jgi:hypothetical protein